MNVRFGPKRKLSAKESMLLNCDVGEDSWESLGQQGDPNSPSWRKSVLNIHRKDWCWSWNYNTLATWCEELTHWKRPWCWERLRAGGEGDDRGWDGWMSSPAQGTWVWVNYWSLWWTGRPGVLWFMGSQRVGHDWMTKLNWTETLLVHNSLNNLNVNLRVHILRDKGQKWRWYSFLSFPGISSLAGKGLGNAIRILKSLDPTC